MTCMALPANEVRTARASSCCRVKLLQRSLQPPPPAPQRRRRRRLPGNVLPRCVCVGVLMGGLWLPGSGMMRRLLEQDPAYINPNSSLMGCNQVSDPRCC
jgi:hypothetical protein